MSYGLVTPIAMNDLLDRCEGNHVAEVQVSIQKLAQAAQAELIQTELALYAKFSVLNAVKIAGSIPTALSPLRHRLLKGESEAAAARLAEYESLFEIGTTDSGLEPYLAVAECLTGAKQSPVLAIALKVHRTNVLLKTEVPFFSQLRISAA